jgi:hypothetical protein
MALPITEFFENAEFEEAPATDPLAATNVPAPSSDLGLPEVEAPGFGPIVPDTTQGVTAEDSPGQLFTTENMGADNTEGFLTEYVDKAGGVQPEETVLGQLENVLNEENPLFDWARGQAAQYANSRGLLNSDIAAEATSQSILGVALPIAEHDANVYAQAAATQREFWYTAGLQAFDATIQSGLMAQDHIQRMVEMSHQGDINSRLQLEQFGYNWNLNEQQNLHNMQLATLQGNIQAGLALQQFGFDSALMEQDFGYRLTLQNTELKNALTLSAQNHDQDLDRINVTHGNTLTQIAAQGDQNARQSALDAAEAADQSARDAQEASDLLAQQGDLNAAQSAIDAQEAADQAAADALTQKEIDDRRFTQDLQREYLRATEQLGLDFSAEAQNIWRQEGLTSAQQQNAVEKAWDRYLDRLAQTAAQYATNPYWDPAWIISPVQMGTDPTPGDGDTGDTGDTTTPDTTTPTDVPPPTIPDYDWTDDWEDPPDKGFKANDRR